MMKKTKFKKDWVTRGIAVCGFAVLGGSIIHIPAVASLLEVSKMGPVYDVQNNHSDPNMSNPVLKVELNGEESSMEVIKSLKSEDITSIDVVKSDVYNKVEVKTKNVQDHNKFDKGTIENYPDAYLSTEKIAEYKGGQIKLMNDLSELINYPEEAKKEGIQGRVVVRFQINPDGSVSNCEVIRSINPLLDREAVRVVEQTSGNWIPGEVDGKPVASIFNIPVTFKLSGQESK